MIECLPHVRVFLLYASSFPNIGEIKIKLFLIFSSCSAVKHSAISQKILRILTSPKPYPIKIMGCSTKIVNSFADKYFNFLSKSS